VERLKQVDAAMKIAKENPIMCLATKGQVGYARMLLHEAGYSIRRMDSAAFTELGATMRERNGTVENWLKGKSVIQASRLIQRLKWECRLNRHAQRIKEPEEMNVLSTEEKPAQENAEVKSEIRND
jgi:hypothetical protein